MFHASAGNSAPHARAHAGIADANTLLATLGWAAPRELMPKADEAARHTLALDDSDAEAYSALAHVLQYYNWNWASVWIDTPESPTARQARRSMPTHAL